MGFFTSSFMNARREELFRSIRAVQYQLDGKNWRNGTVNSKEIIGNSVVLLVNIPCSGSSDEVTGIRILDENGAVAGSESISILRNESNSVLVRLSFALNEII